MPFGPSVRSSSPARGRDTDPDLVPPTANDFWGEDSASLQDALQAPAGAGLRHASHANAGSAVPRAPREPCETTSPEGRQATGRRTAFRLPSFDRPFRSARRRAFRTRSHPRLPACAAAAVGVIAGLALIVSLSESGPSARPKRDQTRGPAILPALIVAAPSKPSPKASTKLIADHRSGRPSRRNPRTEIHRTVQRARPTELQPTATTDQTAVASSPPATDSPAPVQTVPSIGTSPAPNTSASSGTRSTVYRSASPGPTGTVSLIGAGTSPSG